MGVGATSAAQGNGAWGSTVGEGDRVAVACSVMVCMTACGSETSVPFVERMECRVERGAPCDSFRRRCKSWIASLGFCVKRRVRARE